MRIGLDAHGSENIGGDVAGAVRASRQDLVGNGEIVLIGDRQIIFQQLEKLSWGSADHAQRLHVVNAPDIIPMDMEGTEILRREKSSIFVGARMLKEHTLDAFCSAGNSSTVVTAATMVTGRLPGVSRPGLAVGFPNAVGNKTILADLGALKECKPEHLAQLAIMADCYWRAEFSEDPPRIGLYNIGKEDTKGPKIIREANTLMRAITLPGFNYIGFVEGNAILDGSCDVVICDGVLGNGYLKAFEVLPVLIPVLLSQQGMEFDETELAEALSGFNYERSGGVLCLGINGTVMITHGKASELAIANMLARASKLVNSTVNDMIRAALASSSE